MEAVRASQIAPAFCLKAVNVSAWRDTGVARAWRQMRFQGGEVLELLGKGLGCTRRLANATRYGLATGLKRRGTPMERIPASERTRERLKALMGGEGEAGDGRSELVRLAARL